LDKVPPTRAPQKRGIREKSFKSSRGPAAASATNFVSLPFSKKGYDDKVRRVARVLSLFANYSIIKRGKDLDLPTYLPREFGGMGYVHPDDRSFSHIRPFFLKGLSSLLSDNRNLNYILNFRTLGSFWFHPSNNAGADEAKRLYDSWVGSVFTMNRKVLYKHDLVRSMDNKIWERPSWLDVTQFYFETFGTNLETGDWSNYDRLKDYLFETTGFKWYPIKEVLDHVETNFRMENLFYGGPTVPSEEVPSLPCVSKRVHRFYRNLLKDQPPSPDWRKLRSSTSKEVFDILHWRQNLVLVASHLPLLENFKSRW
jgi:hypothetical protein